MFRSARSSTEYQKEPRIETGNAIPRDSSEQRNESFASPPPDPASLSRPLAESEMIAREIREGTLSAFVGAGTEIRAEVTFKSLLRIGGLVSGRVTSDEGTLVVAAAGRVEANINVAIARINGTVTGDVVCSERIELGAAAKVTGNIQAPTLIIDRGAVLDGLCRMTTPLPEPETGPDPETAAVNEIVAQAEAIAEPQVAAAEPTVTEPAIAAPQEASATKAPKLARKPNVMKSKPKRARTKVTTARTTDAEPDKGEQAAVAAG